MAIIKCKMCGGDLELVPDSTVCECEYCGTRQTVPAADDEKKLKLFERANRLRRACEFDKAAGVYESIVADFDTEAEAYWGLVLCKFGIEYVDDPATGKKVPTCHRAGFESVEDDVNFEQACENADAVARRVYREEGRAIDELRERIIEVSGREEPYDIFISYKELAEDGERTEDSVLAQDIYDALTAKGYRVFFSRVTLEDKLGVEYEPYIFAALQSAKVMLLVGMDYENLNAVWVKNEWSRYLALMAQHKEKVLIPCYKAMDPYDLPKEVRKLAAQDMGKVGAMQDLLRGVEKILPLKKAEPAAAPVSQQSGPNVASLLRRAQIFLEDHDWENAMAYCEKVLDIDPENADAYLCKALAKHRVQTIEEAAEKSASAAQAMASAVEVEIPEGGFAVTLTSFGEKKINVIKAIRGITRMGLAEAKSFVESLPRDLMVSEAQYHELLDAGATVVIAETGAVALPSSNLISVTLLDYGEDKIRAIRGIREIFNVGLAEAKAIAESLPRDMTITRTQLQRLQSAGITAVPKEAEKIPSLNPEDLQFSKDSDYQKFLRFASADRRAEQEQRLTEAADDYRRQAEAEAKRRAEEAAARRRELEQAREAEAKRMAEELQRAQEAERRMAEKKAEEERRVAAEKAEAERRAAAEKAEAERKAAAEKAEAEREAKLASLEAEQAALCEELKNLKGLFTGKRRREIETRLNEISSELKKLG